LAGGGSSRCLGGGLFSRGRVQREKAAFPRPWTTRPGLAAPAVRAPLHPNPR